ncbi:ABC transporter substrate-binding protein [Inconstantimicrobium mannanitabidum]|uniref:ABC transporter substrate-binding protein n=1 Tax=Inconstantimicrobium mannanitabidum TaxID=1604901 RepID=A0ACB5R7A6_9CLOT|nr:ABC transporter substrate-binding protein [Clostridium sp. TW13]GKX64888.1 ABC transporter substrate-binding protein [Clostridium sp. TW13]
MKRRNKVKFLMLILFFCISLASCKADVSELNINSRDYINYGVRNIDVNFRPFEGRIENMDIYSALFDGLFEENKSGAIVPVLLEGYKKSNDGLEYILTLKKDIYWSDGSQITSQDVISYFSQVLSQKNNSDVIQGLYSIYGVKAYHEGKIDFSGVAIIKVDDKNIKIRMNNKDDALIQKLADPRYRLVKDIDSLKNLIPNYKKVVYSGAYRIQEVNSDGTIMLKHNEKYWDRESKAQEKIKVSCYSSTEMALADLQTNKIDVFKGAPISEVEKLYVDNKLQVYPLEKTLILKFNLAEKSITSNLAFRRAIDSAIKYELYNYLGVKSGIYEVTRGDITRNRKQGDLALFTSENVIEDSKLKEKKAKSIQDAKSLLSSIGDVKMDRLNLLYEERDEEVATLIKNCLLDNLKININLVSYKNDESANNQDYDMKISTYDFSKVEEDEIYKDILIDSNCKTIEYEKNKFINMESNFSDKDTEKIRNVISNRVLCLPLLFENQVICKSAKINYVDFDKDGNVKLKSIEVK